MMASAMSTGARLKTAIKIAAKKSLYRAGYYHIQRRLSASREKRLVILMYHHLSRSDNASKTGPIDDDSPTPSQFEAHLREVIRRFRVVSLRDAVAEILSAGALNEDSVAITFDDGIESVYTVAYPLLAKYDIPATVFVVSKWVEDGCLSWWQRICEIMEKADLTGVTTERIRDFFGPDAPTLPRHGHSDLRFRRRLVFGVEPVLRKMSDNERTETLDRFQKWLFPRGGFVPEDSRVVTWQQIREMARRKIEIESHTRTHIHIATTDISMVEDEIQRSKAEIEHHTQREVLGFAYPYGRDLASYVAVEPILRKHGFTYACNACQGSNGTSSDLYSLYRYSLPLTTSTSLINRELILSFTRRRPDVP
jgi:peptidoglycan/xylan/chitin deacetylase (PgdA/CDA1 family)